MQIKLLEVRDRATFIPVFALSTYANNEEQRYLLRRVGFETGDAVIMAKLNGEGASTADPYFWDSRTMQAAHIYITDHFAKLKDGDVIDVEFILGETDKPKISERMEVYE